MIEIEKPKIECVEDPANGTYGKFTVEPLGARLRYHAWQCAAPHYALVPARHRGDLHQDRRRAARVLHHPRRQGGCDRDRAERQEPHYHVCTMPTAPRPSILRPSGPCEVTAGDIKGDSEVEVLNPDLHIATLDAGATLNMELTLAHGRGYVSADRNKTAQTAIGVIPVDSHLHARVQGQLHRGEHPCGQHDRLRQADA